MLGLHTRALAVDLGPWIGAVELDVLDGAPRIDHDMASAALLQPLEDLVLDLDVPGVIVLAGLQHGAGSRDRVAAPLHFNSVEVWTIGAMIGGIELSLDEVARIELQEAVGAGTDWL